MLLHWMMVAVYSTNITFPTAVDPVNDIWNRLKKKEELILSLARLTEINT